MPMPAALTTCRLHLISLLLLQLLLQLLHLALGRLKQLLGAVELLLQLLLGLAGSLQPGLCLTHSTLQDTQHRKRPRSQPALAQYT